MVANRTTTDAYAVVERAQDAGLRLVRFLWCGNDGTIRAKASTLPSLARRLETGIGGTFALQAMNALDQMQPVEQLGQVGEVRLVPDLETFRVLPYAPRCGALLGDHVRIAEHLEFADYFQAGEDPAPVCQRTFLKRMESRLGDLDAFLRIGFENEFTLAMRGDDRYLPVDRANSLSTIALTASQDYTDELLAALEQQEIGVDQFHAESEVGQLQIAFAHRPGLRAADDQIYARETIRGVAAKRGLAGSLAPRPWLDNSGPNSCHIHFSLWSADGRNRFHSPGTTDFLSSEARGFLAGILEHLPGLCGLTAPSFNSYPRSWGGQAVCWGYDNRAAPLRVPSALRSREGSTSGELKVADASCNPYLALGGVIAAGLDGLVRGLQLPEPIDAVPLVPSTADQGDSGEAENRLLPENQSEALDALEADRVLMEALGPNLAESYLAVRRSEWAAYSEEKASFEQQGHFLKY